MNLSSNDLSVASYASSAGGITMLTPTKPESAASLALSNGNSVANLPNANAIINPKLNPDIESRELDRLAEIHRSVRKCKIMIIDDEELVIRVVKRFLVADGYADFVTITDPRAAWDQIRATEPDVVLLDINMPHITGLELLEKRQRSGEFHLIPFIVLSANSENETKREALKRGATDFLSKPVDSSELILRVQNSLTVKRHHDHMASHAQDLQEQVRERTRMLEKSREQIIQCLARAAEFRDNETGEHIIRVGKYSAVIARQLGFNEDYCHKMELASQLHDVGKIGIPDSILLSPNKLSTEEFEIMKTHCELGMSIMSPLAQSEATNQFSAHQDSTATGTDSDTDTDRETTDRLGPGYVRANDSPMLQLAVEIAKSHHEKWDGTGYPSGLKGENIPIAGRIVCVADVFDALLSERPYKPGFSLKKSLEIMISERGTRFDPKILDAFFARLPEIEKIRKIFGDRSQQQH